MISFYAVVFGSTLGLWVIQSPCLGNSHSVGHELPRGLGLLLRCTLVVYSHKFCAAIAWAYIPGRNDEMWNGLSLG